MAVTRINLGAEPRVEVKRCDGNLEIRGWTREDTIVETGDLQDTVINENVAQVETDGNCAVRIPEGGSIHILKLDGNLSLKDVRGSVQIDRMDGAASIRHVGELRLGRIEGMLNVRDTDGTLTFEKIGGHVTLRDIQGTITGGKVGGHFSAKNIPMGAQIERIGGNLAVRTEALPETTSNYNVDGSVEFSVPEAADVRFMVKADGSIKGDSSLQTIREGDWTIFLAGSGSSQIQIEADGSVRIKQRSYFPSEDEFAGGFEDFSDHLEDTFIHLDAQFGNLESQLDMVPPHIRGQVSRKLDAARRKMVEAQRRVERSVRSVTKDIGDMDWGTDFETGIAQASAEPVTEQERLLILQMVEEGKISVMEAQKLLDALEGRAG